MNPTHHNLRSYRKKAGLTQQDVAELMGTKDVSQISRYETSPIGPQMQVCLLYQLLFDVPSCGHFYPAQKEEIRKRLLRRIPNIIDELKCLPKSYETDQKITALSKILSTLTPPSI